MSNVPIEEVIKEKKKKFLARILKKTPFLYPRLIRYGDYVFGDIEKELTGTQEYYPLYTTDLSWSDLGRMFPSLISDFRRGSAIWALGEGEMFEIPGRLARILEDFELVNKLGSSKYCPADIQSRLDNILVSALAPELKAAGYSSWDPEKRSYTNPPLNLLYGKYLKYNITYDQGRKRALQGPCDYSLWHSISNLDPETLYGLTTNFIVYRAKEMQTAMSVEGPCLAFMVMVHDIRKRAGMRDSTIYGLASDSHMFIFLKIDNGSRVSNYIQFWTFSANEIYSLLRMIIRSTMALALDTNNSSAIPVSADPSIPEALGYSICDQRDIMEDSVEGYLEDCLDDYYIEEMVAYY